MDTSGDDVYEVTTAPTELHTVLGALEAMELKADSASLTMIPKTTVKVEGNSVKSVLKLMENLEDNEDVQAVYGNFDISEEDMAAFAEED